MPSVACWSVPRVGRSFYSKHATSKRSVKKRLAPRPSPPRARAIHQLGPNLWLLNSRPGRGQSWADHCSNLARDMEHAKGLLQTKLCGTHGLPTVLALGIIASAVFRLYVSSLRSLPCATPVRRGPSSDGVAEGPILGRGLAGTERAWLNRSYGMPSSRHGCLLRFQMFLAVSSSHGSGGQVAALFDQLHAHFWTRVSGRRQDVWKQNQVVFGRILSTCKRLFDRDKGTNRLVCT